MMIDGGIVNESQVQRVSVMEKLELKQYNTGCIPEMEVFCVHLSNNILHN